MSNLFQIEDKFYDGEKFSKIHPGGPMMIEAFCGVDATEAYLTSHRKKFPHDKMKGFLVSKSSTNFYINKNYDDYFELVKRVEEVLPRAESWANWQFFTKIFFILSISFLIEFYVH